MVSSLSIQENKYFRKLSTNPFFHDNLITTASLRKNNKLAKQNAKPITIFNRKKGCSRTKWRPGEKYINIFLFAYTTVSCVTGPDLGQWQRWIKLVRIYPKRKPCQFFKWRPSGVKKFHFDPWQQSFFHWIGWGRYILIIGFGFPGWR